MKIIYDAPKGYRIKKGTSKVYGTRQNNFIGLTCSDYYWWVESAKKWKKIEDIAKDESSSSHNNNIKNLKQAIRHLKKQRNVPKGTKFILVSLFGGYSINITV